MKSILDLALWKTRWLMKEKSTWVNMFILPIVFSLIFGGIQSNEPSSNDDFLVKVGIVPNTTQVKENLLIDVIGHQLDAEIVTFNDKKIARKAMENNEVEALVLWQENFEEAWAGGEQTPWEFVYERQTASNFMMEQQMKQLIIGLNGVSMTGTDYALTSAEQVEKWLDTWKHYRESTIGVKVQYGEKPESNHFSRVFVGFSLMFLMFSLNNAAATILEEKQAGTWNRLLLSPISRIELVLGNILHFTMIGLFQFIVLMAFSTIVFNVNWGYYLDTLLFVTIIILTVSGLGFMLATFVQTKVQQGVIGSLIITVTSMLGGVYWPLSIVSDGMRAIANFIPQKWAMEGLLQLMSGGYRIAAVVDTIIPLLGFLIVFYTIGIIRIRRV